MCMYVHIYIYIYTCIYRPRSASSGPAAPAAASAGGEYVTLCHAILFREREEANPAREGPC